MKRPAGYRGPMKKGGSFLPPFYQSKNGLAVCSGNSQSNQQQQWNNVTTSRRRCSSNFSRRRYRFSSAASESGGSSNRQSGSKSDLFHILSPVICMAPILQRRRHAPKTIPRAVCLNCLHGRMQRVKVRKIAVQPSCRQISNTCVPTRVRPNSSWICSL